MQRRLNERLPLLELPASARLALTVALCLAAWGLRDALTQMLPPGALLISFVPAVVLASFLFGATSGTIATALCGLVSWYFYLPPAGSFGLTGAGAVALAYYLFACAVIVMLVSWMQRANRSMLAEREANAQLAQTRELLFRELQHRVSNNLQMVAALLSLHKKRVTDEEARSALDEAAGRLATIGRISRQIYDSSGSGRDLRAFLDELALDVIEASGRSGISHAIDGEVAGVVEPDAAIPLALIVAETIANAIEHGFATRDSGRVTIRLAQPEGERLSVEVEDDGNGLPAGFSMDGSPSLGLQIAGLLARQIGGEFTLGQAAERGAVARLEFPLPA